MNADELLQLSPILRALQPYLESEYNIRTEMYQLYRPASALKFVNVRLLSHTILIVENRQRFYVSITDFSAVGRSLTRPTTEFAFDPSDPNFVDNVVKLLQKYQCAK